MYCNKERLQKFSDTYNGRIYLKQDKLQIHTFDDAIVLPLSRSYADFNVYEYGALDNNGHYIRESGKFMQDFKDFSLPASIPYDDREVIYCGHIANHYGHFLLETTVRLWYYLQNRNHDSVLCFSAESEDIPVFAREFFNLLGIEQQQITITTAFRQFRRMIIPEPSFVWWSHYTKDFLLPFHTAAEAIPPGGDEKIYLSRKNVCTTAMAFGEGELEKVMNENGFKSVEFQFMSLREQISSIKGAKVIAGINGTAMHNVLFSGNSPDTIILNRSETPDIQYIINEAVQARSYLIEVFHNPLDVVHGIGPFIVGVTRYFQDFSYDYGLKISPGVSGANSWVLHFMGNYVRKYRKPTAFSTLYAEGIITQKQIDILMDYQARNCSLWHILKHFVSYIFSSGKNRNMKRAELKSCIGVYKYASVVESLYKEYVLRSHSRSGFHV